MNIIPARLLRAHADDLPGTRHRLTDKEREQEKRIIAAGVSLFARFGRAGVTMGNFALSLRMSPATVRRHFADLDTLLAEILYRHLAALAAAIGEPVRQGDPTRAARRRAYLAASRTPYSAPTERHLLLLRERHGLPRDLLQPIEDLRLQLGDMLAGDHAEAALSLLDTPSLQSPQIEAMLGTLAPMPEIVAVPDPIPLPAAASPPARSSAPAHDTRPPDTPAGRPHSQSAPPASAAPPRHGRSSSPSRLRKR